MNQFSFEVCSSFLLNKFPANETMLGTFTFHLFNARFVIPPMKPSIKIGKNVIPNMNNNDIIGTNKIMVNTKKMYATIIIKMT